MKKKIILLVLCIVVLLGIYIQRITSQPNSTEIPASETIESSEIKKEIAIPRAEAFRLVSYLYYTDKERSKLETKLGFKDVSTSDWFYEYMIAMYEAGFHNQVDQVNEKCYIRPLQGMNAHEGEMLFRQIASSLQLDLSMLYQSSGVNLTQGTTEPVTRSEFLSLYEAVVEQLKDKKPLVTKQTLYILSVDESGDIYTDRGQYYGGELFYEKEDIKEITDQSLATYIDHRVEVMTSEDRIIYVNKEVETPVQFENVYIVEAKNEEMTVFVEGITKRFRLESTLEVPLEGIVGNITCQDGVVKSISVKPDQVTDKVLLANEEYIELEHYGKVEYDSNFRIYKIYGTLEMEQTNSILVGYSNTKFVLNENKISAALITEPISVTNLRVMIMADSYKSLFHDEVTVTCKKPFTITYGKKEKKFKGEKEVTIQADSKYLSKGRLTITADDGESKIKLLSVKRKQGNPSYRGSIEISATDRGLVIINEVPMEEYLYAVLPSEMPVSYGMEALKVQAVCARSYAYKQLLQNSYRQYGAHIDDSTAYQVYNNYAETKETINAVKETCGQVITYEDEVITAYYFSTSCGSTSSMSDVWGADGTYEYLQGALQSKERAEYIKRMKDLEPNEEDSNVVAVMNENLKSIDFSDEMVFREFLEKKTEKTIEEEFAWYRWKTELSYEEIKENLESKLQQRYEVNPKLILTEIKTNGMTDYESLPISTIGDVTGIEVVERKPSGIVTKIRFVGTQNTILVCSEYNVRTLLAPTNSIIYRQDDSKIENQTLLPSAFFVTDQTEKGIKITGGGYGHGVGMSQNGVKALSDLGYQYEEIVAYYYRNTHLKNLYV